MYHFKMKWWKIDLGGFGIWFFIMNVIVDQAVTVSVGRRKVK